MAVILRIIIIIAITFSCQTPYILDIFLDYIKNIIYINELSF